MRNIRNILPNSNKLQLIPLGIIFQHPFPRLLQIKRHTPFFKHNCLRYINLNHRLLATLSKHLQNPSITFLNPFIIRNNISLYSINIVLLRHIKLRLAYIAFACEKFISMVLMGSLHCLLQ